MTSRLALLALLLGLAACARTPQPPGQPAGAPAGATASHAPDATPPAAGGSTPASTGALTAAAQTQQEGADTGAGTDSSDTALERVAALPPEGRLPAGRWVAGTNYKVQSPAQPTDAAPGKVEVIEMFWYGCPHCYALDPYLQRWLQTKAPYIDFVRVPVMWGEVQRAHARLFYTLQALGRIDALHTRVFDEIHRQHDQLYVPGDDKATLQVQQHFAQQNGIAPADFLAAYNSFDVQTALQHASDLEQRYRIDGVPTIVINGKYESDVGMAGGENNLIALIDDLAAAEKRR